MVEKGLDGLDCLDSLEGLEKIPVQHLKANDLHYLPAQMVPHHRW